VASSAIAASSALLNAATSKRIEARRDQLGLSREDITTAIGERF
jgi:hypothetical protein